MAFTASVVYQSVEGAEKVIRGTYTNSGGGTGGDINTTLSIVNDFTIKPKGSSVIATASVINETFPLNGSNVTIVTSADEVGYWEAKGY